MLQSDVIELLRGARFAFSSEKQLQQGIAQLLESNGVAFTREFRFSPRDRVDFFLASGVALEVKIAGSVSQLFEQVQRYAADARVSGIVIVASRSKFQQIPSEVGGKPVEVVVRRGYL